MAEEAHKTVVSSLIINLDTSEFLLRIRPAKRVGGHHILLLMKHLLNYRLYYTGHNNSPLCSAACKETWHTSMTILTVCVHGKLIPYPMPYRRVPHANVRSARLQSGIPAWQWRVPVRRPEVHTCARWQPKEGTAGCKRSCTGAFHRNSNAVSLPQLVKFHTAQSQTEQYCVWHPTLPSESRDLLITLNTGMTSIVIIHKQSPWQTAHEGC